MQRPKLHLAEDLYRYMTQQGKAFHFTLTFP